MSPANRRTCQSASELQVLPALVTEPEPLRAEQALDPQDLPRQAAHSDEDDC